MYAAAADAVNDKLPNALHVISHLLGMSIELALKAYLCNNGVSTRELRKIGHDLGFLYERAQGFGLAYTGSRNYRLRVLGENYETRIFAYPEAGQLDVINPSSLREITQDIIVDIFTAIKGETETQRLSGQPGLTVQSKYPENVDPSAWAVRYVPNNTFNLIRQKRRRLAR